ncbi:MAG: response regulator [Phycisphaerales bacterium]|nr:response regulator [Phycisphaerales bacterium]
MSHGNGTSHTHTENRWADKRVFTTGEAAEVCKVSQQTIIRCFDSGRLGGFRVPGSKFRRIPREELLRFMKDNDIPAEVLEGGRRRVLIVDDDMAVLEALSEALGRDGRFEVKTATNGYDAGMLTESFRPHVILLDVMLPDINGQIVCQRVRQRTEGGAVRVLLMSGQPMEPEKVTEIGADDFLAKPFRLDALLARLGALAGV